MSSFKFQIYSLPKLVARNGQLWFKLRLDAKLKFHPDTWQEPVDETDIKSIVDDPRLSSFEERVQANNATGEQLSHPSWRLSWTVPPVGSRVGTYAFPNHAIVTDVSGHQTLRFRPDVYLGVVQEAGEFRDRVIMPVPYLRTDFRMHAAASGGPIWQPWGGVVGINCSEYGPEIAYGIQIRCLEDSFIDDAVPRGEEHARRVTLAELVRSERIKVDAFADAANPRLSGTLVCLDQMAPIRTRNALSLDVSG